MRALRSVTKNSFVSGLIFGAIFSLIVNVITVQIQEIIKKQRILEAIEMEIASNIIQGDKTIAINRKVIDSGDVPNYFRTITFYSRDLWEQSSDPLQYIAQLDPTVQNDIHDYYTVTLKQNNQLLNRVERLANEKLLNCDPSVGQAIDKERQIECTKWNKAILEIENLSALNVGEKGIEVLKKFHPTKDRLNNIFLRILMGDKSTRFLSGS